MRRSLIAPASSGHSRLAPERPGSCSLAALLALLAIAACGGSQAAAPAPAPAPAAMASPGQTAPATAGPAGEGAASGASAGAGSGTVASGNAASAAGDDTHAIKPGEQGPPSLPSVDVATGKRGAVTSHEKHATAVGRAILERGGNAVDAAVAL